MSLVVILSIVPSGCGHSACFLLKKGFAQRSILREAVACLLVLLAFFGPLVCGNLLGCDAGIFFLDFLGSRMVGK